MDWITLTMARSHGEELRRDAARRHLARLATCCRPSTWQRWAEHLHRAPRPAD